MRKRRSGPRLIERLQAGRCIIFGVDRLCVCGCGKKYSKRYLLVCLSFFIVLPLITQQTRRRSTIIPNTAPTHNVPPPPRRGPPAVARQQPPGLLARPSGVPQIRDAGAAPIVVPVYAPHHISGVAPGFIAMNSVLMRYFAFLIISRINILKHASYCSTAPPPILTPSLFS